MISSCIHALGKVSNKTHTGFSRAWVSVLVLSYLVTCLDSVIPILRAYSLQQRIFITVAKSIIQKLSELSLHTKTSFGPSTCTVHSLTTQQHHVCSFCVISACVGWWMINLIMFLMYVSSYMHLLCIIKMQVVLRFSRTLVTVLWLLKYLLILHPTCWVFF